MKMQRYGKLPDVLISHVLGFMKHGWIYNKKTRADMIKKSQELRVMRNNLRILLLYTPTNDMYFYRTYSQHFTRRLVLELTRYTTGYISHHKLVTKCLNMIMYYMKRMCVQPVTDCFDRTTIKMLFELKEIYINKGYRNRLSLELLHL